MRPAEKTTDYMISVYIMYYLICYNKSMSCYIFSAFSSSVFRPEFKIPGGPKKQKQLNGNSHLTAFNCLFGPPGSESGKAKDHGQAVVKCQE